MKPAAKYTKEIREFLPIEFEGLKFHPLKVKHFALYQNAKPAMELMLSTLPVRYVRMTWIEALEALDREAAKENIRTGYFVSLLLLLNAALQIDAVSHPENLMIARKDDGRFGGLVITQGETRTVLNENHFSKVREILAAQNGYQIPDENWNPDLVRAQAYLREQKMNTTSSGSLEDAVFALAAAVGQRALEIYEWPIREFTQMQSAVDRRLRFMLCGAAELSGQVKFTKGNPYPTWIWEHKSELPSGFTSLKELDDGAHGLLGEPNE